MQRQQISGHFDVGKLLIFTIFFVTFVDSFVRWPWPCTVRLVDRSLMLVLKYLKTHEEFSSERQAADTYIEIRCRPQITELPVMLKEYYY